LLLRQKSNATTCFAKYKLFHRRGQYGGAHRPNPHSIHQAIPRNEEGNPPGRFNPREKQGQFDAETDAARAPAHAPFPCGLGPWPWRSTAALGYSTSQKSPMVLDEMSFSIPGPHDSNGAARYLWCGVNVRFPPSADWINEPRPTVPSFVQFVKSDHCGD